MGTLFEKSFEGTIKSAEEMLALWQQVESDIATIGQSYAAPGGVEVTLAEIDKVRAQVTHWENRVAAKRGYSGQNIADIEPSSGENAETL